MQDRKAGSDRKRDLPDSSSPGETHLESAGEVTLDPQDEPPKPPEGKHIHPRRPLPPVPEAPTEDDQQ